MSCNCFIKKAYDLMVVDKEAVHLQKTAWFMSMLLFSPGLVPLEFSFMVASQ